MRLGWLPIALLAQVQMQPAAAQDSSEVVVEGSRSRDRQIREFVSALTPAPIGGQIGRYSEKVCPAVVGLPDEQIEAVTARLKAVAGAAGIKVAGAGCGPNALLIVADDKEEFLAALREKHPAYFQTGLGDPIRMPKESGPTVAWHIEGLLDYNDLQAPIVKSPGGGKFYATTSVFNSRIRPNSRPHFIAGVLVVERSALPGLTTTQLADYAAMRIYGRTEPARLVKTKTVSILSVIDAPMTAQVPITLTHWDLLFLKSLYSSEPLQYAAQQRAGIARGIRKVLKRSETRTR